MVIRVGRGGGGRGGVSMEVDKFRKKRKMKCNELERRKFYIFGKIVSDCFVVYIIFET